MEELMLSQFLNGILSDDPLQLPRTLDHVYSGIISELRREFPDLDQCHYSLDEDDDSPRSAACQLYKLYPSHCLKFLQALATVELASLKKTGETDILAWPSVTVVDIGCGAGAASTALLGLLQNYQQFLIANGKPISPIRVLLIGFDPSESMLGLYDRMMKEYAELLSPWLVDVRYEKLAEPFPQGVRQLTHQFRPTNLHSVLLAMSNVIRPFGHSFQSGRTSFWVRMRQALLGRPLGEPVFGEAEASAIRSILVDWELDQVGLLSIATSGKDDATGIRWHEHLGQMNKAIEGHMSPHIVTGEGIRDRITRFENPRASWWWKYWRRVDYQIRYYFSYSTFTHESYGKDEQWQSVMSPGNIELAWVRARRYALREALTDEVEVLLFDYEAERKLDRLRKRILARDWKALNVDQTLFFGVPKKRGETRPKAACRLEDQTLGAAIIQSLGANARYRSAASYSYRLNRQSNEFLYEHWLHWWKQFMRDTHKSAKSRDVLRSDVKGFYQNIEQDALFDIARRELGVDERTGQLLQALLFRDCGPSHDCRNGLPQGHIASGFWADLYLAQIDEVFSTFPGVKLARYADDMVFTIGEKASDADEVRPRLETALKELGLDLSGRKTYPQAADQYISETELDDLLDRLHNRFKRLVIKVYRIDTKYQRLYKQDAWGFVSTYRRLLRLVSIHVSISWLRRKLEQHSSGLRWLLASKLRFPAFPSSPDTEDDWSREFLALNADWKKQIERLRHDLADLCQASIDTLSKSASTEDTERDKARRRLRFAANRLCVLGLDEVADLLAVEIAQRPWNVQVRLLCQGLADCDRSDLLLQILDTSDSAFARAWAVRALAEIHPIPPAEGIERMWAMLLHDSSTTYEKLKASEALLFADRWETADFSGCEQLIEHETDPYLLKNYALIISQAFGEAAENLLRWLQENCSALIVVDAVQYALQSFNRSPVHHNEPDVLLSYYSGDYPIVEADAKEDQSPFRWVF